MIQPTIIKNETNSSRKIFPQIIPNTGKKYATVEVFTAPTFSISLTYPINERPVETIPSHNMERIASLDGNESGIEKAENGISKIVPITRDQPINTNLFIDTQYFWIKTPENA